MHADEPLDQHRAVADRPDVATPCRSSSASCPMPTSAWKPEIAPHAMVMNTNGNSGPGTIGPPPPTNSVSAGIFSVGFTIDDADDRSAIVPIFMNELR